MSAFEDATKFFHACETLKGWAGCKQYVAPVGCEGQVLHRGISKPLGEARPTTTAPRRIIGHP
jgi:hypothetical protein